METATEPKEEIISTSKQQKEQPADGTQYSIYDFFRINTGVAIAVISGIVAVSSFVFRCAGMLYSYEYLRFWDIDITYARQEDAGVFHTAFSVFIYYCLLTFSQFLLGNTAIVHNYHNRFYLIAKMFQKKLKRNKKVNERIRKRLQAKLKNEAYARRKRRLIERISKAEGRMHELSAFRKKHRTIFVQRHRTNVNVLISAVIAVILCMAGAWFFSVNYDGGVKTGLFFALAVAPVLLNLLMHAPKRRPKIHNDHDSMHELDQYQQEILDGTTKLFPVEAWVKKGFKFFLTNKMIGTMVLQYLLTVVACVVVMVNSGGRDAEQLHEFRVWTDGESTYAVVYDNGTQVIMEPISIHGDCAVIDTSSQRIIKLDDLSYEIYTFDCVVIIRCNSTQGTASGDEIATGNTLTTNN